MHRFPSKELLTFNFMAVVTVHSDFGAQKYKICHCYQCFPIYLHEVMGHDTVILVFWTLSFKTAFSLSSLILINRLIPLVRRSDLVIQRTYFIFLGSKITVDSDCSHEIKRYFFLGRKAMTTLDSVLKSRDIALPIKVRRVKAMVFSVVMYGCESWTIKRAEHQRIDAFEQPCWREGHPGASCLGDTPSSLWARLATLCPTSRVKVQLTPCRGHLWRCRGAHSHGFMIPLRNWEETYFLKPLGGLLHEIRLWQFS